MTITVTLTNGEGVTRSVETDGFGYLDEEEVAEVLGAIAEDNYHGDLDSLIGDLEGWEDAFIGYWPTPEDFVADQVEDLVNTDDFPWLVIDYRATWERNLRHDYSVFADAYYFHNW